jgi:hypothetical protein
MAPVPGGRVFSASGSPPETANFVEWLGPGIQDGTSGDSERHGSWTPELSEALTVQWHSRLEPSPFLGGP